MRMRDRNQSVCRRFRWRHTISYVTDNQRQFHRYAYPNRRHGQPRLPHGKYTHRDKQKRLRHLRERTYRAEFVLLFRSVNGQIHYYRYDVNFAYMAVDGTTIVDKSHADASALWRVMTQAGDATHARRYQHLQTGKWLKCEITNGQVVWELVDDVAHSSLITHQWTTVLDYQKDARTFAYPIILNGTEAFYIYFDQQAAKWTYSKDVTGIIIDPMYCEKWSEHKSLSLELDALLPAGTNYFAFTQGDAGTQECQITIWPKLADSTYIHSVPEND